MLFVATIPIILLGIVYMGDTTSIIKNVGLANSITSPIVKLSKIANSMSTGELKNPEIMLLSNDEIGELQTAFNRMINTYKILDTLSKEDNE